MKYVKVTIDGQPLDVDVDNLPLAISYKLEDPEDFQKKKSAESFNVQVPATTGNDALLNTFHDPAVEDMTTDEIFRSPRAAVIAAEGHELLVGKAFLKNARHTDKPTGYELNFYGANADWMIDLKEATLFDFLQHISFVFNKATIEASWLFDGTDEALPYAFAPVRYRRPFGGYNIIDEQLIPIDDNVQPIYMRPALSKYWLLYWAFKSVGYKIESEFLDTEYFRRQVMPWTWGGFLEDEGTRLNVHKFLAKGTAKAYSAGNFKGYVNMYATNDSSDGAYDNNNEYSFNTPTPYDMTWEYKSPNFGTLQTTFQVVIDANCSASWNSDVRVDLQWYKNGALQATDQVIRLHNGTFVNFITTTFTTQVAHGDVITLRVYANNFASKFGNAYMVMELLEFSLASISIPLAGTIDFSNFLAFKKYKFLDFLRGIIDEFNLTIQTDSVSKRVYIEPTHPYSLTSNLADRSGGYFNENYVDWDSKQDLSKESVIENFADYERETIFRYREDSSDGIAKIVQDRESVALGSGKYVLPERFKSGKREVENRFFSPVMHYEADQFKDITGVAPQFVIIVPENISNTSAPEAQNTFAPKSCYYKGLTAGVGGWKWDNEEKTELPFMFAVNYKAGGEEDPILSYSDENIDGTIGHGLLRRFYLQRLAIMRNGQLYSTAVRISMSDVTNFLHREHIICRGQRWELVEIKGYQPLKDESTSCLLRRWVPVSEKDADSVYPSPGIVTDTGALINSFDTKYAPLKCLPGDIPS